MNIVSQSPESSGRMDEGHGNEQSARLGLSRLPPGLAQGAVSHNGTPCRAHKRSGKPCLRLHALRTTLRSRPVQAYPRSTSISDMDRSC